jgi:hypothetical protein
MADSDNARSHRTFDPQRDHQDGDGAHRSAGGDPLAELARLIGQSDPFADFERDRRYHAETRPGVQAAAPPPADPPQTQADLAAAAPEPYPAGVYAQYPDPDQPADPAYGYSADAYAQGYDPYYDPNSQALDEAEYYEQQSRKRRQRRLAMVVAILALAVFGGAGAYAYRTFFGPVVRGSAPPVIKADTAPNKVLPVAQAGDRASNKQIVDRVGERSRAERMVPREEKPVDIKTASVPPAPRIAAPAPDANAVAAPPPAMMQVTPPRTGGDVLPVAAAPSAVPQGTGAILPSAKKVRTVTIRPDMTVVPSAPASRPEPVPPAPASSRSVEPAPPPPPRSAAPPPPNAAPSADTGATRSVASPPARQSSGPLSLTPEGISSQPQTPRAAPGTAQPLALAAAPTTGGGSYAVQVSSQRSEAEATASYKALQARYPSILGGRSSFVRRADLGSRGVYYRSMVGPFATAEQATQFCSSLKSAGGQCIIHRN